MIFKKACAFFERDMLEAFSYKSQLLMDLFSIFAKCFGLFFLAKLFRSGSLPAIQAYGSEWKMLAGLTSELFR